MTIEAVLLDVGGVFVLPDDRVLLPLIRANGAPSATADDLARAHYHAVAAMDRAAWTKGVTAHWPMYNEALATSLGIPTAAGAVIGKAFVGLRWSRQIPASIEALPRLADTGVSIGIVSNSDGTVEEQLLEAGICQVGSGRGVSVMVVVDSFIVGIEKPDPAIFRHALGLMGVSPAHAIHVGDTGWADVEGARAAGLRPVHFDPLGLCVLTDDHDHVTSIDGVVELVRLST
jgi:putative hydrolase of the HAD superfamily